MGEPRPLLGPIGSRIALATVGVALAAIVVVAVLTLVAALHDVSQLVTQEEDRTAALTAEVAGSAYRAAGSWDAADLRVVASLAAENQAELIIRDQTGQQVTLPVVPGASTTPPHGPLVSEAVIADGRHVGTSALHFHRSSYPAVAARVRDALARTVALAAGLAVLLALGVAVALSRWITRPVVRLTDAVRSLESGDGEARIGSDGGTGELAELAAAFDHMADSIVRENELRRAVVADVAHELRTPLAILQAGTESLADGLVAPTRESLASLHEEVLRLGRTVEDLDTLASAEAAGLRLDCRSADAAEVVEQVGAAWRAAFGDAAVGLTVDTAEAVAWIDAHRVGQIVTNLVSNALKFSRPGDEVTVTARPHAGGARIVVADTGMGIPSEELDHVFDRFWRGREAGRLAGSGIGLAVVRTLVDAHGGRVSVTSTPRGGSRFTVWVPGPAPP